MLFKICFRCEQTLYGDIEVEADNLDQARALFEAAGWCSSESSPDWQRRVDDVDMLRCDADLDLDDSEDTITEIQDASSGEVLWVENPGV